MGTLPSLKHTVSSKAKVKSRYTDQVMDRLKVVDELPSVINSCFSHRSTNCSNFESEIQTEVSDHEDLEFFLPPIDDKMKK